MGEKCHVYLLLKYTFSMVTFLRKSKDYNVFGGLFSLSHNKDKMAAQHEATSINHIRYISDI